MDIAIRLVENSRQNSRIARNSGLFVAKKKAVAGQSRAYRGTFAGEIRQT
jgi:hypothetical protein